MFALLRRRDFALVWQNTDQRVKSHRLKRHLVHRSPPSRPRRQAASIAARSADASSTARATLSPAARTMALPTATPSAILATAAACSGRETPNPTHTGNVVDERFLTHRQHISSAGLDGHNGRFAQNDSLIPNIYQRVSRT